MKKKSKKNLLIELLWIKEYMICVKRVKQM